MTPRFLTPIGRCTVAKTILLAKINHLAFVFPKIKLKKWPDKIRREDAKHQWGKGGMDMPDIRTSWRAFKTSWLRRLISGKGTWIDLFKEAMRPKFIINNPQAFVANLDLINLSYCKKFIRN